MHQPTRSKEKLSISEEVPQAEPGLSVQEEEKVEEKARLRAAVVYEIIRAEGEGELARAGSALWWSGLAAGISMGFSFLGQATLAAHLPDAPWRDAVASFGYSIGFLIVILGRQQLFTENTLTPVLPVMAHPTLAWIAVLLRLWAIVFAANMVGGFLFALTLSQSTMFEPQVVREFGAMVEHVMANTPGQMFLKAVGAGWLVAALVWMMPSAEGSEFPLILVMGYLIALFGFTHIVAGSAEIMYGWLVGQVSVADGILVFLLPTLAGNVVGGTLLFGVLSYRQVREEIDE
jgi:formate-nitrite transporter family protein